MTITEIKLRQIVRQELLNLLEGRQPTEDLAIFHKLLNQLGTFHFGGKEEEQTLSFLNNEMIPTLQNLINQIENADLQKLDENILSKLKYYFGKEKEAPYKFEKTDLQNSINQVKNKLRDLRDVIINKRAGFNKQYQTYHTRIVLPILQSLQTKLEQLITTNTQYPSRTQLTKSDILKRTEGGY
jgi:hypothetical protein